MASFQSAIRGRSQDTHVAPERNLKSIFARGTEFHPERGGDSHHVQASRGTGAEIPLSDPSLSNARQWKGGGPIVFNEQGNPAISKQGGDHP